MTDDWWKPFTFQLVLFFVSPRLRSRIFHIPQNRPQLLILCLTEGCVLWSRMQLITASPGRQRWNRASLGHCGGPLEQLLCPCFMMCLCYPSLCSACLHLASFNHSSVSFFFSSSWRCHRATRVCIWSLSFTNSPGRRWMFLFSIFLQYFTVVCWHSCCASQMCD